MSGDLAGLFARTDQPYEFRQGTVTAWDTDTGQNTIAVAGGVLTDLPVLESSGVVNLSAGDVVQLIRSRSSWAILGRVHAVGSGDFAAASVAFDQDFATADTFATGAGVLVEPVSFALQVPGWANEALVTATACASCLNSTASTRGMYAGVTIDGVGGGFGSATSIPAGLQGTSSATRSRLISGPSVNIIIGGEIFTSAAFASSAANQIALTATAIFRRV